MTELPREPFFPGELPGVPHSAEVDTEFAVTMFSDDRVETETRHISHTWDILGLMRPSTCDTCAKSYEVLRKLYPHLPPRE